MPAPAVRPISQVALSLARPAPTARRASSASVASVESAAHRPLPPLSVLHAQARPAALLASASMGFAVSGPAPAPVSRAGSPPRRGRACRCRWALPANPPAPHWPAMERTAAVPPGVRAAVQIRPASECAVWTSRRSGCPASAGPSVAAVAAWTASAAIAPVLGPATPAIWRGTSAPVLRLPRAPPARPRAAPGFVMGWPRAAPLPARLPSSASLQQAAPPANVSSSWRLSAMTSMTTRATPRSGTR